MVAVMDVKALEMAYSKKKKKGRAHVTISFEESNCKGANWDKNHWDVESSINHPMKQSLKNW